LWVVDVVARGFIRGIFIKKRAKKQFSDDAGLSFDRKTHFYQSKQQLYKN